MHPDALKEYRALVLDAVDLAVEKDKKGPVRELLKKKVPLPRTPGAE